MNRFDKKKEVKQKTIIWFITIGLIVIICVLGKILGPVSPTKAIKLAQQYQQQGLYCSGYHFEKGDLTCYVVFRDKKTNQEKKTINVSDIEIANKIHKEYGDKK